MMLRFIAIRKRPIVLALLNLFVCVSAIYILTYRSNLRQLSEAKREVASLIQIGEQIEIAQAELIGRGFDLVYEDPIDQTGLREYVSQLVVVGETKRGGVSKFLYAVDSPILSNLKNPLGYESPYVVIHASPDGVIYKVEY